MEKKKKSSKPVYVQPILFEDETIVNKLVVVFKKSKSSKNKDLDISSIGLNEVGEDMNKFRDYIRKINK